MKQKLKQKNKTILFLLPSLLGVSVFVLIPFIDVIRRSFVTSIGGEFVGTANYQELFANSAFRLAAKNTIRLALIALPLLIVSSLLLAMLLHSILDKAGIFKTAFLLPMAIPVASIVLLWRVLFHNQGLINGMIVRFGGDPVKWMESPTAFWVLVGTFVWKNIGYNVVLWIAGLADISPSLYEAAQIDGANKRQIFFRITLPELKPCLYTIVVLSLVNMFKVFREAWLVAGDYPHSSMYLLQHLFNNWFRELSMEKLSAAAVVVAVVTFLLILVLQKVWDTDE